MAFVAQRVLDNSNLTEFLLRIIRRSIMDMGQTDGGVLLSPRSL
jgi:hypothetical protein